MRYISPLAFLCMSVTAYGAEYTRAEIDVTALPVEQRFVSDMISRRIEERTPPSDAGRTLLVRFLPDASVAGEDATLSVDDGLAEIRAGRFRGHVFGAGLLLRNIRYGKIKFSIDGGERKFRPGKAFRICYFARHFENYYDYATPDELTTYIDDLVLAGYNAFSFGCTQPPKADRDGNYDRTSAAAIDRIHALDCAYGVGGGGNQLPSDSPEEFRGVPNSDPKRGNLGFNACPSKPGAMEYICEFRRKSLKKLAGKKIDFFTHWPFDEGGCECEKCKPWGGNGFLRVIERLRPMNLAEHPNAKTIVSTWVFHDDDWEGLYRWLEKGGNADYIMADSHEDFPEYPLRHAIPKGIPVITFPEISMWGRSPWGGYGATALPKRFARLFRQAERISNGFECYSEGIYEDINKEVVNALYVNPDINPDEVLRNYASYHLPGVDSDDFVKLCAIYETNHFFPGTRKPVSYAISPSHPGLPEYRKRAAEACRLVEKMDAALFPAFRNTWRWRLVYLRAMIDREILATCHGAPESARKYYEELVRLYHGDYQLAYWRKNGERGWTIPFFHERIDANWPALDPSDALLYKSIYAPRTVAVQPAHTHKEMSVMPDGEIRYYGRELVDGKLRNVYLSSRDRGLSWKTVLQPNDDYGPMVKCPWSDYYLKVIGPAKKGGVMRCLRTKDGPPGKVDLKLTDTTSRSLAFYRPMQPLEKSRRWIMAGARTIDGVARPALSISSDDGETWHEVVVTNAVSADSILYHDKSMRWNNGCCEPTVVELSNGDLMMAVRATLRHHYMYTSKDGGETWSGPNPAPAFYASNTMPTFLRLKDGRILFFWNNTEPLPKRDPGEYPEMNRFERAGMCETVFTNRDALHAAISEDDGRTWIGFREVALNSIRNREDFREYFNLPWREHDKSVHQTQPVELPDGKILLPYGQGASARICLFDISWLYETDRHEEFKDGLEGLSNFLYVKSLIGNFRGWSGHCAFNRVPGALLVRAPDTDTKTQRDVLQICRISDERLVSDRQGVVWNFPAGKKGRIELECRIDGEGFQLALCDRWFNPCDEFVGEESALAIPISAETLGGAGLWAKLALEWDWKAEKAVLTCDGRTIRTFKLNTGGKSPFGPSYMHLQTLAKSEDAKGAYFRSFHKTAR